MNVNMGNVRYNAGVGAFEARVDIKRGDVVYRYPCQIAGPVTMDPAVVRQGLESQALRMSDSSPGLMSSI